MGEIRLNDLEKLLFRCILLTEYYAEILLLNVSSLPDMTTMNGKSKYYGKLKDVFSNIELSYLAFMIGFFAIVLFFVIGHLSH